MEPGRRVQLQPGWILHRRDFRDSSQIIDVLTRDFGRIALVARGVKRPKSRYRGVLQPFTPLLLSWVTGRGELATMTGAEILQGDAALPATAALRDTALLAGFYVNELILKLTHRFDPQPAVFGDYQRCLGRLAAGEPVAAVLRDFELDLLDELGFGLAFDRDARSGASIDPGGAYHVVLDEGPRLADAADEDTVPGEALLAISRRDWSQASVRQVARRLLARAIDRLLDGKSLRTRRVLRELKQREFGAGGS